MERTLPLASDTHGRPAARRGPDFPPRIAGVFASARLFGADHIVRKHLGLPADHVLPLTIPHGVDTYINRGDLDLHTYEPLYLALRPDIAERVSKHKRTILFPHPWLMMDPIESGPEPHGTLIVSPPPSEEAFERTYAKILEGDYPKPWGILLKDRGLSAADVEWWKQRGFEPHSAGPIHDGRFYYKLREIIARYGEVASPNMSSAVVFSAQMGKRVSAVPDVILELVEVPHVLEFQDFDDASGTIKRVWSNLVSGDVAVAMDQAHELLGAPYLDTPEKLREKYLGAVADLDRDLHLHPVRGRRMQALLSAAIRRGVPLHRLYPDPATKVKLRLTSIFRRDLMAVVRGSDFAHYGIAGSSGRLSIRILPRTKIAGVAQPGYSVRGSKAAEAVREDIPGQGPR